MKYLSYLNSGILRVERAVSKVTRDLRVFVDLLVLVRSRSRQVNLLVN
jgi:hypothetical protein